MIALARRHASDRAPAIGRAAIRALYAEIALYPKPGLVSPRDSGAHQDMDFSTFLRSLNALRVYFPAIAQAGAQGQPFSALQCLGLEAEARMLKATGGINTHRGAIFSLGLLAGAAGALPDASAAALGHHVARTWGADLLAAAPAQPSSHGLIAARAHGARGAREEAAEGFPLLVGRALPHFRSCLARTGDEEASAVETLFVLMQNLDDTNLLHRGGLAGLAFARDAAGWFLARGGVCAPDWRPAAEDIHRAFVARRLSPGGAADMLAATLFLHQITPEVS